MAKQPRRWRMSRRGFLIGVGVTGVGLALGAAFGKPAMHLAIADALDSAGGPPSSFPKEPLIWFDVPPRGPITLYTPKVEMGQGIHTALAQIAAEELELGPDQIVVAQGGTALGPADAGGTSASNSVVSLFTPLREVAATLREMLRGAAAARLGVPATELVAAAGAFSLASDPARRVSYGELVADKAQWVVPEQPPALKPASAFTAIGQSWQRVDIPAKLSGAATYGYDMRLPNMLYGAVARPATIEGRLRRAAPGSAANAPGVVAVLAEGEFAGVAAESRAAAFAALGQLDLEWENGRAWQQAEIDALVDARSLPGVTIQRAGNAGANLGGELLFRAEYRTPLAAHAHLEPQAALADVQPDKVRVWSSTQVPASVAGLVAAALGREAATVEVLPTYLGGGFGRRLDGGAEVEAARLSAAAGRPVHVGWTRTEEFRNGFLRPPTHSIFEARLEGDKIVALSQRQASGDVLFGFFPAPLQFIFGADLGAWRGARLPYAIEHLEVTAARTTLPVKTGSWRGLGLLANVFAVESFIDELAHAAGRDPLAFRLANLPADETGARLRKVLETAAERGGWGQPAPAGRARGIALTLDARTAVAHVVELSMEQGRPRVHRVSAAVDPGLVINPDGAAAQSEGAIAMGLSAALFERITIADGAITAGNFNSYPLLTMADAPEIDVVMISSGEQPFGMGEPPMGPIAAAVANAIFALTGERRRELPFV
jgi:isoquinoline 1-oxidoreductase beta subunit